MRRRCCCRLVAIAAGLLGGVAEAFDTSHATAHRTSIADGLRLAEFVGQGETLIQKLVGIAMTNMMRDSLTEAEAGQKWLDTLNQLELLNGSSERWRKDKISLAVAGAAMTDTVRARLLSGGMTEQQLSGIMTYNRLMTIEALRMHAAEHDGHLPESLDQLSPVPAMPVPFTDQPFQYEFELVDGHAIVSLKSDGPANYKPLQELRVRF